MEFVRYWVIYVFGHEQPIPVHIFILTSQPKSQPLYNIKDFTYFMFMLPISVPIHRYLHERIVLLKDVEK